jgi:hypothetical protein
MNRVSTSDPASLLSANLEDMVSATKPSSKVAHLKAAPDREKPAAERDTFEKISNFFGFESAPPRPKFGPNHLPNAPAHPREQTWDVKGLKGCALEDAQAHNSGLWTKYEGEYKAYLRNFKEVYAGCDSLTQLRKLEPEPPAWSGDALPRDGYGSNPTSRRLDVAYRETAHGAKVDAGYRLIGKTPPGTLLLVLKGDLKAGSFKLKAEARADSSGGRSVHADRERAVEAEVPKLAGVKVGASSAGRELKDVEVGYEKVLEHLPSGAHALKAGLKASIDHEGEARIETSFGALGAAAIYDPGNATFGGGVSVGRSVHLGPVELEAKVEVDILMRGMTPDDVKKCLSSWLAREDR